jgi:hypothetical protein
MAGSGASFSFERVPGRTGVEPKRISILGSSGALDNVS